MNENKREDKKLIERIEELESNIRNEPESLLSKNIYIVLLNGLYFLLLDKLTGPLEKKFEEWIQRAKKEDSKQLETLAAEIISGMKGGFYVGGVACSEWKAYNDKCDELWNKALGIEKKLNIAGGRFFSAEAALFWLENFKETETVETNDFIKALDSYLDRYLAVNEGGKSGINDDKAKIKDYDSLVLLLTHGDALERNIGVRQCDNFFMRLSVYVHYPVQLIEYFKNKQITVEFKPKKKIPKKGKKLVLKYISEEVDKPLYKENTLIEILVTDVQKNVDSSTKYEMITDDPKDAKPKTINGKHIVFGRNAKGIKEAPDICFPDGSVSRKHFDIFYENDNFFISCLSPTNPTQLRLTQNMSFELQENTLFNIGLKYLFRVMEVEIKEIEEEKAQDAVKDKEGIAEAQGELTMTVEFVPVKKKSLMKSEDKDNPEDIEKEKELAAEEGNLEKTELFHPKPKGKSLPQKSESGNSKVIKKLKPSITIQLIKNHHNKAEPFERRVEDGSFFIGSDASCQIRLEDPKSEWVEKKHCKISFNEDKKTWEITHTGNNDGNFTYIFCKNHLEYLDALEKNAIYNKQRKEQNKAPIDERYKASEPMLLTPKTQIFLSYHIFEVQEFK